MIAYKFFIVRGGRFHPTYMQIGPFMKTKANLRRKGWGPFCAFGDLQSAKESRLGRSMSDPGRKKLRILCEVKGRKSKATRQWQRGWRGGRWFSSWKLPYGSVLLDAFTIIREIKI